uniref:Uncharacterized protein n=1 Tax=Aegilops tauschii subsp. strangulata TaxID=200361 RepID=A0A453B7V1_AEGTS
RKSQDFHRLPVDVSATAAAQFETLPHTPLALPLPCLGGNAPSRLPSHLLYNRAGGPSRVRHRGRG